MVNEISGSYKINEDYSVKTSKTTKLTEKSGQTKEEASATVEIRTSQKSSATYTKPVSNKLNSEEVARLKEEANKATETIRQIVRKLIAGQGDVENTTQDVTIDKETQAAAAKAISEDGEWGVKAVSKRIVEFAKAISGGDLEKLSQLKEAIEEGFKAAAELFGGELPQISKDTYNEVMRQLDEWKNEGNKATAEVNE